MAYFYEWWETLKLTEALGLWGALLSTITAASLWLAERPSWHPSKGKTGHDPDKITLTYKIHNNSRRRPFQIVGYKKLPIWSFKKDVIISRKIDKNYEHLDEFAVGEVLNDIEKKFSLFLAPNQSATILISGIHEKTGCIIVVFWHQHGLMPRLPKFIWISWKRAQQIRDGSPDYLEVG